MHKFFSTLLLLCSIIMNAQNASFLSLDEAISIGLQKNYIMVIDSNNVEAAAISNSLGNAGFLPKIDLSGTYTYGNQNINQQYSNGNELDKHNVSSNSQNAGASLSWTLFDGGKMFATAKILQLEEEQTKTVLKTDVQNLIANIIIAYYNVVQQKQMLLQMDSSLKYYNVQLQTSKNLQLNGKGTRQQVLQSQINLNSEQAQYYSQLNTLQDAKTNLNQLLQRNADEDFDVIDSISIKSSFTIDTTEQFLRAHSPALEESNRNVDVQAAVLMQNRSLYWPQLTFNAGYGYNNSTSSASFFLKNQNLGWNVGATLNFSVFDGFKNRTTIQLSKINVENAHLQYQQVLSETRASVSNAYHKYFSALRQKQLLEENLSLAKENLSIAIEEFKLYAITLVELQQAQKSYDDAGAAYISSLYNVKSAETNLLLLSGLLVQ